MMMAARKLTLGVAALAALTLLPATAAHATKTKVLAGRVSVTLVNTDVQFRDVAIAGKTYTVGPHNRMTVTAPSGTVIYAASTLRAFQRGDIVAEMTPAADHAMVLLK